MSDQPVTRTIVIERSCQPTEEQCVCRDIVLRTHSGMLEKGADSRSALEAAVRVFRYHHPETTRLESLDLVENWVLSGNVH